ncbi:MAG: TetR/AcrR family transcriptional regulator [Bacteroidia bacterium]
MSKKEQIAIAALSLFSESGFEGTSTRAIAKKADVSEALIFRHYVNKEGLVIHLLHMLHSEMDKLLLSWNPLEPKAKIKVLMELPFNIPEEMAPYWKFYYKLSWSTFKMESDPMSSLQVYLTEALRSVGFAQPEEEAEITLAYVHGFAFSALNNKLKDFKNSLKVLRTKYA